MPSLGPAGSRLLVVGLAPGLKGANATGRPFTGDHAGAQLRAALARAGLTRTDGPAPGPVGCRITNAVRCVPPGNRPSGAETAACLAFLEAELAVLPDGGVVVALGRIAHGSVLKAVGLRPAAAPFAHGAVHALPGGRRLIDSYHCSRQNTNTGRLTPAMLDAVFAEARRLTAPDPKAAPQGATSG